MIFEFLSFQLVCPPDHTPVYQCFTGIIDNLSEPEIKSWFSRNEKPVFRNYLDDPRNTDNAWLEATAKNYHDGDGQMTLDPDSFVQVGKLF